MWTRQLTFTRAPQNVHFAEHRAGSAAAKHDRQRSNAAAASTVAQTADRPSSNTIDKQASNKENSESAANFYEQIMAQLGEIRARQSEWLHGLQQVSVEIAMRAAEQLLSRRIENGEQDVQNLVREAVAYFDRTATLKVHLSPADLQSIQTAPATFPVSDNVQFVVDQHLQRGHCRVDSADFDLLFDWEARLEEMRISLIQRLHDARLEP